MSFPVGQLADVLLQVAVELGVEWGKGPFANTAGNLAAEAQKRLGVALSQKSAEWFVELGVGATGAWIATRLDDEMDLARLGREVRAKLGSGAAKLRGLSDRKLGALALAASTRRCAFCDTPLPPDAHPNRRYCDDGCRGKAAYRRRAARGG